MSDLLSKYGVPDEKEDLLSKYGVNAQAEPQPQAQPESPGLLSRVFSIIDSYSGAPVRAAVGSLEQGGGLSGAANAYRNQFGQNPGGAPTGKDLLPESLSLSDSPSSLIQSAAKHIPYVSDKTREAIGNITPKDLEGVAADVALDPTSYIPFGKVAGLLGKGVSKVGDVAGGLLGRGEALASRAAQVGGEAITGVPQKAIQTYIERPEAVAELAAQNDKLIPAAADSVRSGFQSNIKDFKNEQNAAISDALKNSSPAKDYTLDPVREFLEEKMANLDPRLEAQNASHLRSVIAKLPEGNITAEQLYKTKKYLQDNAIFNEGTGALEKTPYAKAVTGQASGLIRPMLEQAAKDGNIDSKILEADKNLSGVWNAADEVTNSRLIEPREPEAALIAAGGNPNSRGYQALKALQDATGKSFTEPAENLAAMHFFENPSLLPTDTTGKTVARQNLAKTVTKGLIGAPLFAASHAFLPGGASEIGAIASGAIANAAGNYLASPAALKRLINTGKATSGLLRGAGGLLEGGTEGALSLAEKNPMLLKTLYEGLQEKERKGLLNAQ